MSAVEKPVVLTPEETLYDAVLRPIAERFATMGYGVPERGGSRVATAHARRIMEKITGLAWNAPGDEAADHSATAAVLSAVLRSNRTAAYDPMSAGYADVGLLLTWQPLAGEHREAYEARLPHAATWVPTAPADGWSGQETPATWPYLTSVPDAVVVEKGDAR